MILYDFIVYYGVITVWRLDANPAGIRPECKNRRQRVSSGFLVHNKRDITGRTLDGCLGAIIMKSSQVLAFRFSVEVFLS